MVPGLLKAFFNVNEVISSIMMNYIGMYLVNMMIQRTVYDQVKNQTMAVADGANLPKAGLDKLFPGTNINIGILIAILCVILIYIILNKTTFGYELKACGKNPNASKYAGINAKKSIVLSLCEKYYAIVHQSDGNFTSACDRRDIYRGNGIFLSGNRNAFF